MSDDTDPVRDSTGKGFSLVMELQDPARLPELMLWLKEKKSDIRKVFGELGYVHFARFLPLWDRGLLLIVSEFDGDAKDYVLDFAMVLDEAFSKILSYMKDRPRLPVSRYPDEFWAYVDRYTGPKEGPLQYPDLYCAYPGLSAVEIARWANGGSLPAKTRPALPATDQKQPDAGDVQANVLRGYKSQWASHLGFEFPDARDGRRLLAELARLVTTQAASPGAQTCVTIGLTHAGLQALEVPQTILEQFPVAFREGPSLRSERLGDTGRSAPESWAIAGTRGGPLRAVHGMVSIYGRVDADAFRAEADRVRKLIGASMRFERDAQALGEHGEGVHFGYRDGLGQPRIAGLTGTTGKVPEAQKVLPGDLLLGKDYPNSRGGFYIGELPEELATHGTYAALRVIQQHVEAFRRLLLEAEAEHGVNPELVAAKLMGRWRDGSPLVLHPNEPARSAPDAGGARLADLDDFDYVASADGPDDREGRRCPIGSHIRRLNPRSGQVIGAPSGRRIVRRGLPYGPKYDPESTNESERSPDIERGLVGLFLCGDLESQFEFVQHVWANGDLSSPGLRHTQDPFIGAREGETSFSFRPREHEDEITIMVPPLTRTRGSAYFFMPGIGGLNWLARGGWEAGMRTLSAQAAGHSIRRTNMAMDSIGPTSSWFRDDPYACYAALREQQPVSWIGQPYSAWWVFSHERVKEVCERKNEFLKPGKDRKGEKRPVGLIAEQVDDGLFFMDPPRHEQARSIMNDVFEAAIAGARERASKAALQLLDDAARKGRLEVCGDFAGKLATQVFMEIMGIPPDDEKTGRERTVVDKWVRTMLEASNRALLPDRQLAGATTRMAVQTYFLALGRELANSAGADPTPSILAGMQRHTGCPASAERLSTDEAVNTAVHFALGGYLSTEFLIGSGVYNLLRHPDQWRLLRENRGLLPQAVHEMLRFDAPFQLADRWVENDTNLGDLTLEAGSLVTVVYGSANRDPQKFADPDRFDIMREPTGDNFGFGHGIHYCIGARLAEAITEAAIESLIECCPTARIANVGQWSDNPYFRSLSRLDLYLR